MPLMACNECGASASTSAKECPSCGAPAKRMFAGQPRKTPSWAKIFLGFLGFGVIATAFQALNPSPPKTEAEIAQDKAVKNRNFVASLAVKSLKVSLNDPKSLSLTRFLIDEDGTLVCMHYRAKNAFGALVMGETVLKDGTAQTAGNAWQKNCVTDGLYDVTDIFRYTD